MKYYILRNYQFEPCERALFQSIVRDYHNRREGEVWPMEVVKDGTVICYRVEELGDSLFGTFRGLGAGERMAGEDMVSISEPILEGIDTDFQITTTTNPILSQESLNQAYEHMSRRQFRDRGWFR